MMRHKGMPDSRWTDEWRPPQKDDKYWMDRKGDKHYIPEMHWQYAEACIRLCNNEGWEIPTALFDRWKQRHAIIREQFEELNDD